MMSSNIPQAKWGKVKSELQRTWNKINSDELERTHGDVQAISDLVQEKYSLQPAEAERRIDECIARCGTAAGEPSFNSRSGLSSSASASSSVALEELKSSSSSQSSPSFANSNVDVDSDFSSDSDSDLDTERSERDQFSSSNRDGMSGQSNQSGSKTRGSSQR
ncbi:MAG: hypothetical protein AAGB31_00010 [Bdellovibrio sp.]